ncbi:GNAT family N-acetyltransferase [Staphylococcus cohnii]|uniref:GNAT family N-acetyltransferase n=1 Tax=Staphylococcus cohnii TaxID=29382 RepID=UPI00254D6710|nr:GNAT family N-acetyltransferase [Staphylococcus cohnii]WIL70336.1 GNAT family N-acetyltransferase [Staphylococcus cohnii]
MKTTNPNDVDQILEFLNNANYQSASYLYKLPQMHNDIRTVITNAIQDPGVFAQVNNQDEITMLLLALKYEDNKYKVLGPFIDKSIKPSIDEMTQLFDALAQSKPDTANFNFSFEEHEQTYLPFMKSLGASYSFTDYYLISTKDIGDVGNEQNIIEYQPAYYRYFSKLHNQTFKHDVMTADEIVKSLDEYHRLFIFMSEGLLKGYLYLEIAENNNVAEIKYFSSHSDYRLMGIAFDLLSYSLHFAFSTFDIDKIYFKIRSKNTTLVERFNELGFNINYEYKKFKYVPAYI